MKIKVVSLEGCSATPPTIELLKATSEELKVEIEIEHIIVKTLEEAQKHRHIGSPTIQVNGFDIDPEAREITQYGLT